MCFLGFVSRDDFSRFLNFAGIDEQTKTIGLDHCFSWHSELDFSAFSSFFDVSSCLLQGRGYSKWFGSVYPNALRISE